MMSPGSECWFSFRSVCYSSDGGPAHFERRTEWFPEEEQGGFIGLEDLYWQGLILTCNQYNINIGWGHLCALAPKYPRLRLGPSGAPCWPLPAPPPFNGCNVSGYVPGRSLRPKPLPKSSA